MKLVIPIENLRTESIIKLGESILLPAATSMLEHIEFDPTFSEVERAEISKFVSKYKKMKLPMNNNTTLAILATEEISEHIDEKEYLIQKCKLVCRALDYIKINYCRFDLKDTLPGVPGIFDGEIIGLLFDEDNKFINVINHPKIGVNTLPGLGCQFDINSPKLKDSDLYDILFSDRNDEVYIEFRKILGRACDCMYVDNLSRCFNELCSIIERMGSKDYKRFAYRRVRIASYIASNQKEYESLSKQLYHISKILRTEITHKGNDILNLMSYKEAIQVINLLFRCIYRFTEKVIDSNINIFERLENDIESSISTFDNVLDIKLSTEVIINKELENRQVKKLIIIPIANFEINSILSLGQIVFIPIKDAYLLPEIDVSYDIFNREILEIIVEIPDIKELKNVTIAVFEDYFEENMPFNADEEFNKLDKLCEHVHETLSYLILKKCSLRNRAYLPEVPGLYDRIKIGFVLDMDKMSYRRILGRLHLLYSVSEAKFEFLKSELQYHDDVLFDCLYNNRQDEISIHCKTVLTRICKAMYLPSQTQALDAMFDIIDMLDGDKINFYDSVKLPLRVICRDRDEYQIYCAKFREISDRYRTPIKHYGREVSEIISSYEDIYELFEFMQDFVMEYCRILFEKEINDFTELRSFAAQRLPELQ